MAADRGHAEEWTAKAMTLLRAVQAADVAYRRELGEAFDRYRNVITTGSEDERAGERRGRIRGEPPAPDRR